MSAFRILLLEVLPHPDLPYVVREAITWGSITVGVCVAFAVAYLILVGSK